MQLRQTVGMIGGKPNQAYYFYGYAGISYLVKNKIKINYDKI
jgi:hypothetical protein